MESIRVDRIGEDIIVVDGAKSAIVMVWCRKDKLHEVLLIGSLDTDTVTTYHLLLEPELSVFALKHWEEWLEAFDYDQIFNSCLSTFFYAARREPSTNDNESYDEDIEDEWCARSNLLEEVFELVLR